MISLSIIDSFSTPLCFLLHITSFHQCFVHFQLLPFISILLVLNSLFMSFHSLLQSFVSLFLFYNLFTLQWSIVWYIQFHFLTCYNMTSASFFNSFNILFFICFSCFVGIQFDIHRLRLLLESSFRCLLKQCVVHFAVIYRLWYSVPFLNTFYHDFLILFQLLQHPIFYLFLSLSFM